MHIQLRRLLSGHSKFGGDVARYASERSSMLISVFRFAVNPSFDLSFVPLNALCIMYSSFGTGLMGYVESSAKVCEAMGMYMKLGP